MSNKTILHILYNTVADAILQRTIIKNSIWLNFFLYILWYNLIKIIYSEVISLMKKSKNEIEQSTDNNQKEIENLMDVVINENMQALIELAKQD